MEQLARNALFGVSVQKCPPGILTVEIEEANNLNTSVFGALSPYVVIELESQKAQSDIQKNTNKPVWKSKFYFKTEGVLESADVIITVMTSNQVLSDKSLGHLKYSLIDIIESKKRKELLKQNLLDESFKESKKVSGTLDLYISWQPDESDTMKDKKVEGNMKKFNYDGVFKLTILSGTNLTALDKFQSVFLEIYHDKQNNPKPLTTEKKAQKNAQFNQEFYFSIDKDKKLFNMNLVNVQKERFIAASYDLDLEQFSLDRHKPKSVDLKFENNKFKADVLCEMTFLYNFFTGNPQGVLRIEVLAIPKLPEKRKFYFRFYVDGPKERGDNDKFTKSGTVKQFKTEGRLDKVRLVCYEQSLTGDTNVAVGKFSLCDIPWAKPKENKDSMDYQNKKVVDMVGKELNFQVRVDLKYRSTEAFRTSSGGSVGESLEAKDSFDLKNSIPLLNALKTNSGENSPAKSSAMSRSATITSNKGGGGLSKFATSDFSAAIAEEKKSAMADDKDFVAKSGVLVVKAVDLVSFLLKVKLFELPNFYFSISTDALKYAAFSSLSKNPIPRWDKENIAIYVSDLDQKIRVQLHELNFASVANEFKQPVPIDILCTDFVLNASKNSFGRTIFLTLPTQVSGEFKDFVKKNYITNDDEFVKDPVQALEKAAFETSIDVYASYFVDNPHGNLTLNAIDGRAIAYTSPKGVTSTLDLKLQIGLGSQVFNLNDNLNSSNPTWNSELNFYTHHPMDFLRVKLFDSDPLMNKIMMDITIPLYKLEFTKDKQQFTHDVDLSKYEVCMKGVLTFKFTYNAQPNVSTQSLIRSELSSKAKGNEEVRTPVLADWKSLRKNETVLMEIILQDIALELKLKEEFVVTTEVKVSGQSYYSPRFANMPKCLVMKRFSFMLNPTNEDERFIYFNIKVFDKANPSKILRLYNYIFDWCKYLVNAQDYITAHFELLPSSVHSQEKNTINSITIKYRISTPQVANMSKFGMLGISPLQIRTAGASINDPQLWKNGKSYAMVISYNGMKQFYKARTGEPRKYDKSYVFDVTDLNLPDKTYKTGQLFIDKIDGTESVLEFMKEHPNPKLFPYNKSNNRYLKVTLYQIDPEGLALSMLQLKSNPNARIMAKGVFDLYRLQKDYKGGVYALKLQKELVMNCEPNLIHPVNLQFLDLYLLFEVQESFLEYKETASPNMQGLQLAKQKTFAAKPVKELLAGVVSTKILKMTSSANERKDLIGNVITVRVEKTSKKEDAKVTTTLKNLISNKHQLFVNPDVSFNPTESIFGKTVYFSLMDGPDPGLKLIDTVLRVGEENQDYVREQLRPELSITLKPLKEKVNLDGLPIGVGARVRVCPEIWNDNTLNSEIDLQFGYHENFFTESSRGKFTVSKFDLNAYGGAKIQDIHQVVFSIRNAANPELSNPADAFTIPLNQVGPTDESMKCTRSISMNTNEKTSAVYIQFKDKSSNVLGKLKLNLFELLLINPQSIKKKTVEASDLEQEKIFILPISNPKNPLGYIVFKMWFFYKDVTSLTNVNFGDVLVLFKFKQIIRKRIEKLRRIVYLNPGLIPLVFPAKLARFFYGPGTPQGLKLPIYRMSKIEELKTKMNNALIPTAPDAKVLLKLHLPAKCSFILPGIVSLNQPILIKLSYTSISKSKNQAAEDKGQEAIEITQQLRLDNCTWEKIIQDNATSFKFQLVDSIEFYVPEKDVLQNKVDLSFEYYSKNVGKATLKGLLDYTEYLTQELKSKAPSSKPQSVFLFLKPSNQKLFINLSRISSGFVNNPIGKLHFQVHRLIILDDYKKSDEGYPYENRSLLLKSKVVKEFRSGNHLKFHVKVGMKLDNQKRFTPTMSHQGIPLDQGMKDYVFYTSSYNKDLTLSVLIDPNPPQKELGEEMMDHMEKKALELNEDSTGPLANNIAIAKARVSLSSLPLSDNQTYPVYIPFSEINYPENDLFKLFFDSINRKNIYLLGSVTYKSEPWYNLGFKMEKISGLRVLSNEQDDEYSLAEKPKFGVVLEVTRKKDGGNLQSLCKYESMIYNIEKTDNNVLKFRDDENCGFVFEDTNPTEEITLNVNLSYYQRGTSQVFAKKSIPIRKYFMNNKDTEKPVTIDLGLARDQKIRAEFIDSKVTEFPMTLQFRVLSEYDTSAAASSKKAKKITKRNTLVFNYRENSLEEMMAAIVNSTDKTEITETLKEIKEYLLYTIQEKEVDLLQAASLYNIFRYVYQVYPENNEMNQICIRNILALFNFDPKIIHKVNIIELFEDFNELLINKWKQNKLEAKDEELGKIIAQEKTKFPKREGSFKTLQEVQKKAINEMKPADILQYLKNNSLYKGDGSQQEVREDKEKDHKDLIKVLLYIVKVLDIVNASGEQYGSLIEQKALKIVTKSVALFIKEEESLLAPFLKILRKVLVEAENAEISVDQLKLTLDCLENANLPSNDEQAESFLRIYTGVFNLLLSKVASSPQEQKATYKKIFNYLNLNYKEKDYFYHYQYFEIMLNFAELYKNEIDFVQETLNRNDFSLKFMNYLGLIQRNMEVKLSDNEIKQAIDIVEEIVLKYDAKNVKVDKLIGYLQIMEEKGNVGSTTRLKIDFVIGKLRRMKDGTSAEKKKQLKEKLKATTQGGGTKSSKDVNTKYLISKLDWM